MVVLHDLEIVCVSLCAELSVPMLATTAAVLSCFHRVHRRLVRWYELCCHGEIISSHPFLVSLILTFGWCSYAEQQTVDSMGEAAVSG